MSKVKITLVKSTIKKPEYQKRTVKALGLRKLNHSKIHEVNGAINGMISKVAHLLKVESI